MAARRLDLALIARHPGLSRRKAREVIEKGQVLVDGRLVREPGLMVGEGADLRWDPNRQALPRARLSLARLYEDEHVLIVDKPAGLLSVPTSDEAPADEDTALGRVQEYARRRHPKRPFVGRVHRLDRDTSGALAFALSAPARAGLIDLFRAHQVERRYLALVEGEPRTEHGVMDQPLHEAYEGGRRRIAKPGEPGRPALTRWRVVERLPGAALLEVELGTGRQHQIRVHLAHAGLPVLGDPVYRRRAAPALVAAPRQMLHAAVLGFSHPVTGEAVRVESPWPDDFKAVRTALRKRRPR
jgi:23S rRNA pseudouridine1911/1915/1917 synthase